MIEFWVVGGTTWLLEILRSIWGSGMYPTLSNVIFLIEGRRFYAHITFLLDSSDAFCEMFDGDWNGYNLSTPTTEKFSEDCENSCVRYGLLSLQGWRTTMKDAVSTLNFSLPIRSFQT